MTSPTPTADTQAGRRATADATTTVMTATTPLAKAGPRAGSRPHSPIAALSSRRNARSMLLAATAYTMQARASGFQERPGGHRAGLLKRTGDPLAVISPPTAPGSAISTKRTTGCVRRAYAQPVATSVDQETLSSRTSAGPLLRSAVRRRL